MKKTTLLALAILLAFACGAALAASSQPPAAPMTPAMAQILSGGPPAGAQFVFVNNCEPPTRFVCVNKSCACTQLCGSKGVQSFTCNSTTGVSNCVCNP
jgi:hypothetical protein